MVTHAYTTSCTTESKIFISLVKSKIKGPYVITAKQTPMFEVVYFNAIETKLIVTKINLPEAVSLNKMSCSAAALGVTKFIVVTYNFGRSLLYCATLVRLKCKFLCKILLPTAFKIFPKWAVD